MTFLFETYPLQKYKIVKKSLGGIVGITFFFIILSFFFLSGFWAYDSNEISMIQKIIKFCKVIFPFVFIFGILMNPLYQYFYYKNYFYDIDEKNIIIKKGVISKKEITLPFSRITDVYVDQDILDVLFGLFDIHISTPTVESGVFAHIDGVNKEDCYKIRDLILDKINN